jgi:hypothetical protein
MQGQGVGERVHSARLLALLGSLALAGCVAGPTEPVASDTGCQSFAACLFSQDGELPVVVHLSTGMPFPTAGLAALGDQVFLLSGRTLAVSNGSAIGPLADVVDDATLSALQGEAQASRLDVYVVDAIRMEGDEPTSGLAFPGSSVVFLFPGTMDRRVGEATLGHDEQDDARAALEAVVLAHEFGHALGLVGCGIPMQAPHAHPTSGCHSSNATSLMAPLVARVADWPGWDGRSALGPFGWDADDLADVAAFRASGHP